MGFELATSRALSEIATHYTAGIPGETPKLVGAVKLPIVTNTNPHVVLFNRAHKNSSLITLWN